MNHRGPYYKKYSVKFTSTMETTVRNSLSLPKARDINDYGQAAVTALSRVRTPVDRSLSELQRHLNADLRVLPWWVTS